MAPGRLHDVRTPVTLVARDPAAALRRGEEVLAADPDPLERSTALRLLGMAQRELGRWRRAQRLLSQAAAVAARAGLGESAAHARASRLGLLMMRDGPGAVGTALGRLAGAAPSAQALVLAHQGVGAAQRGRFDSAVAAFDSALARTDPDSDHHLLPGLLSNRGLALMYTGRLDDAAADLHTALRRTEGAALACLRGITLQNLGCVEFRRGDFAAATAHFTAADRLVPAARRPALRLDHVDALLAGGMSAEAGRLLAGLVDTPGTDRAEADIAIARLLDAKVLLGRGDHDSAYRQARRVRRAAARTSLWARLAALIEWSARCAATPGPAAARPRPTAPGPHARQRTPSFPDRPGSALAALPDWAAGLPAVTEETATALARCVPTTPLGPLALSLPAPRPSAALRALADGDHPRARRALLGRGGSGSRPAPAPRHLELLAHHRSHHREAAATGAHVALRSGDAAVALDWIEHRHALDRAPGPCRDTAWLRLLDRCRLVHARARRGDPDARHEFAGLVDRLTTAQWHPGCADPHGHTPRRHGPAAAELAERLGSRAFVCYASAPGFVAAITVVDGRVRLHHLASAPEAEAAVAGLCAAARTRLLGAPPGSASRLLDGRPPESAGGRAGGEVATAAARADRLLFAPLTREVGDRPVVIAPAPAMQALPWGLLPGLRGREVSVVPSGRAWLTAQEAAARPAGGAADAGRVLLAAGRDPEGAAAEVGALERLYPKARRVTGAEAGVGAVLAALDGADLAHLAAHGLACAEAPMLSGLVLEDASLFAYDLECLHHVPRTTVLSACWVGGSVPAPWGTPLGMAASLLSSGGAVVVASVLPVSDQDVSAAMVGFHTALTRGATPSRAVADHLADAGFLCYGAG
ncbi:CHAT domain-containing protein [Streptomonospora sp. S1-112]|uniref:CHAT domain-containing protein n=1 Tax=Streptomonospora mangrovi TaxID=2883123 RepID=A0A9X3SPM6_9ACTN|nr:CHAT domain-containing protein [Streptomonospora mangrovi]MDA0566081.1 CHAT domain-containing protein [Streptomonospora mangrovi]